ncbi:nucleic acid-binding, OB-fold protein [Artemisia annua]|uniref:Nucleic acid-binding, OB-fold protein n=1 Tax=Artemisia annua TaxID=35608 RepID=A0A2U1QNA1_ARTAN|nr:nucleic acid-binding, OB-fold protein [Artemisia annua]
MAENNIDRLNPRDQNRTLEARVYRRWIARNVSKPEPIGYCCILLDIEGVKFTCEASILNVNRSRNWYYTSCTECTSKVKDDNRVWEYVDHGPLPKPTYRYNFKVFVLDETTRRLLTFFHPICLCHHEYMCPKLVQKLEAPDPQQIPVEILAIEGEKHIFQFHYFNTSSKIGAVDFTLDDVLDSTVETNGTKGTPKDIRGTPSSSDSAKVENVVKAARNEPRTRSAKRPAFSSLPMEASKNVVGVVET